MKATIKIILKSFFLLSFFFSLSSAFAQAPERMSYQAVIRNASNTLVTNQAVGMRVSILQGSSTGTAVYSETFSPNPQTNINGLVTVAIGSGTPITGTFAGINWANGPFFIKTETDPTGGTTYSIVGTSQLLSAPYSLYAKSSGNTGWGLSGNAGTNPATNYIGTSDNQDVVFKRNNVEAGRISLSNTSFGMETLLDNTSGYSNVAIGNTSLKDNTTGHNNVAVGSGALRSNFLGNFNTAIGNGTIFFNYNGNNNTALGYQSLRSNTEGNDNTANGFEALKFNTLGSQNTAVGFESLKLNLAGGANTAIGYQSLGSNTNGSENTAIGYESLRSNTTGRENTAIGNEALKSNTTANRNSVFGFNALPINTTGDGNTAIGFSALQANTTGRFNIALGFFANRTNTTGENNIAIGWFTSLPSNTGSNQVRIGNTSITYAGTQVAWSVTSDSRWKENIQPSNIGLNFIKDLKPVSYTRKNDETKKVEYGIIAQDLETSLQKHGANTNGIITKDDEGMYSVRYNDLLAPMIKAIQEQQVMIEELKAEIQTLKNKK